MIGNAVWSSWTAWVTAVPSTFEFCGKVPSVSCWWVNSQVTARLAAAPSPAASSEDACW
jgi:hypothetical protein